MIKKLSSPFFWFLVALIFLAPLRAQAAAPASYQPPAPTPDANPVPVATPSLTPVNSLPVADTSAPPVDRNAASVSTPLAGQAPDDVIKKLSDLTHAEKYQQAQQMTVGLLAAYPDDQRLIKAKTILDKLVAAQSTDTTPSVAQPATTVPDASQSAGTVSPPQPALSKPSGQLTGMDKVEYNSLIEMAKEAQQNTDLDQQKTSLGQFMKESSTFLQKYPDQMQLWEFRVAAALILDNPDAGYEAGQKLLTAGAADSNDPNLQQLLAKLKIKGWLDKQGVVDYKTNEYGWILGTWSLSYSTGNQPNQKGSGYKEVFTKSDSGEVEGRFININNGQKRPKPDYRATILNSGEISWEHYMLTSSVDPEYASRSSFNFNVDVKPGQQQNPSGWQPPISCVLSDDKRTITMVFPQQIPAYGAEETTIEYASQHPVTFVFEKISDSQGQ